MTGATSIEWAEASWNPTTGCDRVGSPGCDNCYALTMAGRLKRMGSARYQNDGDERTSGPGFRLTVHPEALSWPMNQRKPKRIFVNSMSDLFHPDVPRDFIAEVWSVMARCPHHEFLILTKRPKRMSRMLRAGWHREVEGRLFKDDGPVDWQTVEYPSIESAYWLPNVWLGTSIENDRYTWRANHHLRDTPAAVRFLSLEPLLGPLPSLELRGIDWIIIGGESGPGARPMEIEWAETLVEQAKAAGVATFVKQLGTVTGGKAHHDIETFPESLRIREYPTIGASA